MSERSKGFKVGAVSLFVCALGLLAYVWSTNGDDGPAAVPVERAEVAPAAESAAAPEATVVNARAPEETQQPADAAAVPDADEITPERVKQARSFMN